MSRDSRAGQIGVQIAAAALLRHGWEVAVPLVDTGHDLIAYEGSEGHMRVQVKSHSGTTKQKLVRLQRTQNNIRTGYPEGMVDAVAVCNIAIGAVAFAPMRSLAGKTCVSFSSPFLVDAKDLRSAMEVID